MCLAPPALAQDAATQPFFSYLNDAAPAAPSAAAPSIIVSSPGAAAPADISPAANAETWTTTVDAPARRKDTATFPTARKPAPTASAKFASAYNLTTDVPPAAAPPAKASGTKSPRNSKVTGRTHLLEGLASYYASGQLTANGEKFDKGAMTAAHKTLPFGTRVRVTRVDTGSSIVVRINDRGPFKPGRVIDLSEGAAKILGITSIGLSPVSVEILTK